MHSFTLDHSKNPEDLTLAQCRTIFCYLTAKGLRGYGPADWLAVRTARGELSGYSLTQGAVGFYTALHGVHSILDDQLKTEQFNCSPALAKYVSKYVGGRNKDLPVWEQRQKEISQNVAEVVLFYSVNAIFGELRHSPDIGRVIGTWTNWLKGREHPYEGAMNHYDVTPFSDGSEKFKIVRDGGFYPHNVRHVLLGKPSSTSYSADRTASSTLFALAFTGLDRSDQTYMMKLASYFFHRFNSASFGGKPWARPADILARYFENGKTTVLIDSMWNLQHNTGSFFNKSFEGLGSLKKFLDDKKVSDPASMERWQVMFFPSWGGGEIAGKTLSDVRRSVEAMREEGEGLAYDQKEEFLIPPPGLYTTVEMRRFYKKVKAPFLVSNKSPSAMSAANSGATIPACGYWFESQGMTEYSKPYYTWNYTSFKDAEKQLETQPTRIRVQIYKDHSLQSNATLASLSSLGKKLRSSSLSDINYLRLMESNFSQAAGETPELEEFISKLKTLRNGKDSKGSSWHVNVDLRFRLEYPFNITMAIDPEALYNPDIHIFSGTDTGDLALKPQGMLVNLGKCWIVTPTKGTGKKKDLATASIDSSYSPNMTRLLLPA